MSNTNTTENKGTKKISERSLALIITASILVLVIIAAAIVYVVDAIKRDVGFNYVTSDLSKYVEEVKDYKDFEINIDIAKPKDVEIDTAILGMLCADKSKNANYNGGLITSGTKKIGAGDIVNIWYRGYLVGDDGEQINVSGMTNFSSTTATQLEIGSGSFITGFELGLVGKSIGDCAKFEKITEGKISEDMIVYVSFTRVTNGESITKTTQSAVRVDLSDENVDKEFGEGFKERIMIAGFANKIDFTLSADSKQYAYTNVQVDFATTCESKPIVVETYFPYDYNNTELRNEKAYFEVYIDGFVDYDAPTFDEEYLKKQMEDGDIKLTEEELSKYEGETLIDRYYSYAREVLQDIYDESYREMVEEAIWNYYLNAFKIKKYPDIKVEEIYNDYVSELRNQFESSGGQVYNSYTGGYTTYESLDEYAPAYLGLSSTTNWQTYVVSLAENLVKERLIMYYVMRQENLTPTDDVLAAEAERIRQEYLDEYIQQYLDYESKTKEDFTDAEYEQFVEDRKGEIFSYYDDSHFTETAYYNIVIETILEWPTVKTLDDRRAYPVSK